MHARRAWFVSFAVLLVSLSAFAANPPRVLETTELSTDDPLDLEIPAGSRLEIKGVWGDLDIVPAEGPRAAIEITRPVAGTEPRLILLRHEEGYTLCAVHASPNPKRQNECVPGKKGRMLQGNRKDWPRVNFVVRVPEGVPVMGKMFGGRMSARGVTNHLDLEIDSGGEMLIHDAGSGSIDAKNGGNIELILADVSNPETPRGVRLSSLGGNIDVVMPPLPTLYYLYADQPIRGDFKIAAKSAGVQTGRLGPDRDLALVIRAETALLGRITLRKTP